MNKNPVPMVAGDRVHQHRDDHRSGKAGQYPLQPQPLFEIAPSEKSLLHTRKTSDRFYRLIKRLMDFSLSILLVVLLTPLFLLVILSIWWEDGRPIFFTQRRSLIKGGKEFSMHKFRSMDIDAECWQDEFYGQDFVQGGLFLLVDDPRVTRVGRFLRTHSLDELPQLWNVIRGEMSLVGPRPLSISDISHLENSNLLSEGYEQRGTVLPGMTGLWQISGRRETGFREMVTLDRYYIEHQSLLFDVEILLKTIPVILSGRGAY